MELQQRAKSARPQEYEALIDIYATADDGLAIVQSGTVRYVNQAMVRIAGTDLTGRRAADIFSKELLEALGSGRAASFEEQDLFGRSLTIRCYCSRDAQALIFIDPTQAEKSIREQAENLEALENLCYRMGTAITNILSGVELIESKLPADTPDKVRDYLAVIHKNTHQLRAAYLSSSALFQDMQGRARDKGCRPGNIAACVRQAAADAQAHFAEQGVQLQYTCSAERIDFAFNPQSVEQMVLQLLAQELADAKPGGIVALRLDDAGDHVSLTVCDDAGPAEDGLLQFLFGERIEELGQGLAKYGENLYLVKRLAAYYDGRMSIENTKAGKRIAVCLPRNQIAQYIQEESDCAYAPPQLAKTMFSSLLPLSAYRGGGGDGQ